MNEEFPLIFLPPIAEAISYRGQGFGPGPNTPERERNAHGERLIQTFEAIWANVATRNQERQAVAQLIRQGTYLEFVSAEGFDLVTKSLDDVRAGIKLLNIRERSLDDGRSQTLATVFIPTGKEQHFIRKIRKYLDENRNQSLVESIEDVRLAILESFWTDPASLMPTEQQEKLCELWLRAVPGQEGNVIARLRASCELISIDFFENRVLRFPERVVCLIRTNRPQLLELIEADGDIAEVRAAKETAAFWMSEPNIEQVEWTENLLARMQVEDNNVSVCVLDTGVNNGHPLLNPVLPDTHRGAVDPAWGLDDNGGHGTLMSGVAAFGDLESALESQEQVIMTHGLQSVKILPPPGAQPNDPDLYGAITQQAISIAEIQAPEREQIFCNAVTGPFDHRGRPTSWSAAIDSITSGQVDGDRRLFIVSAGNVRQYDEWENYPNSNRICSIEDPAQSWNALTVGAYTEKITITDATFAGHTALAPLRSLSPFSRCSLLWESKWPLKPEIVMEGGNIRQAPDGTLHENFPDLSILSTSSDSVTNQFDLIYATSAATAKASYMAARIKAKYPDLWPETLKALIVHSAEWPQEIIDQFGIDITRKTDITDLIKICGFGVPDLKKALYCDRTFLTQVSQETIQPYKINAKGDAAPNDMHFYELPWPRELLLEMGAAQVKMRITLCYFIEPSPGEVGWKDKYRYASHGLRFDVNNTNETRDEFNRRVNIAARAEGESGGTNSGTERWTIGANNRSMGSVHSDIWEGNAADMATCNLIAVYPVVGWWKERKYLGNVEKAARYSLIVSLITPPQDIDIYTPVATAVETIIRAAVPISVRRGES